MPSKAPITSIRVHHRPCLPPRLERLGPFSFSWAPLVSVRCTSRADRNRRSSVSLAPPPAKPPMVNQEFRIHKQQAQARGQCGFRWRDGSIDWLWWPRFDSRADFCPLLTSAPASCSPITPWSHSTTASNAVRIANARQNTISRANARLCIIRAERTKEDDQLRRIYELKLDRSEHPMFALSWMR